MAKKKTAKKNTASQGSTGLKIVARKKETLSKEQKQFNRLTKQIENLEKKIAEDKQKFESLLTMYHGEVDPLNIEIANGKMDIAFAVDEVAEKFKFTNRQLDDIGEIIVGTFDSAFRFVEPNEQQEMLYDKWSPRSYKDCIKDQFEQSKDMFSGMMRDMFGVDMDFDFGDFDPTTASEEEAFKFTEKLKQEMEEKVNGHFEQETEQEKERPKSKRQMEKETAEKAKEAQELRSIRSVYITLAKVLHPDTESDDALRAEKEEVMKQVTKAYDEKDLSTLLKLEMEWVHRTAAHLNDLSADQLKTYIEALKKQVAELKEEQEMLRDNPRYAPIEEFMYSAENSAKRQINQLTDDLKVILGTVEEDLAAFKRRGAKSRVLELIEQFYYSRQASMLGNITLNFDVDGDEFDEEDEFEIFQRIMTENFGN